MAPNFRGFGARKRVPLPADELTPLGSIDDDGTLIADAQQLSSEGERVEIHDLDVDGTALLFTIGQGGVGYEGWFRSRDGAAFVFASGGEHATGALVSGSIDRGVVAWLRKDEDARVIEAWRWDGAHGARIIQRLDYELYDGKDVASGWVLVADDVTVTTLVPGMHGSIVAHHPEHGAVHVAATQFATLHRDGVAESLGLRRAAVNTFDENERLGVVEELDLDVWPPRLTRVATGYIPGASTQMGQVLGELRDARLLAIPGAAPIAITEGAALDPIGDGRFVAFGLWRDLPPHEDARAYEAVLVEPATGRRMTLTAGLGSRIFLRGTFVAWGEATGDAGAGTPPSRRGVQVWVAQLNRS